MEQTFDVIVIGAGPAGSSVAKGAAQAGLRTLILEKRSRIGIPVLCAEAIDTHGLEDHASPRPSWIASEIHGARIFGPNGQSAEVRHPRAGYVLERGVVDRDLAALAVCGGATLWVGAKAVDLEVCEKNVNVTVFRNDKEVKVVGHVVVGADGIVSSVGKWAGLRTHLAPNDLASCCQYLLAHRDISPGYVEFHVGNRVAPGGYCWTFSKGDGLANVGVAISPSKSRRGPRAFLDDFVQRKYPQANILGITGGAVPLSKPLSPSFAQRLLVVGDAARLTDPLSGAGIANALRSGRWAAETIMEAFASGDFSATSMRKYEKRWRSQIARDLSIRYWAKEIFLEFSDDELNDVIAIVKEMFAGRSVESIEVGKVVKSIVKASPKLFKLTRRFL